MKAPLRNLLKSRINHALNAIGFELVRQQHRWDDPREYLPFAETIRWARQAHMSVGDYVEATYNVPGAVQDTIDRMIELGVFDGPTQRICEIGPGTGRYLEKTLQVSHASYYEFYETATPWARWLVKQYPVTFQPTDGSTLSSTPTASIDLVQAHKVFVATPFLTTYRYFMEMTRVARMDGKIVFDVMTEACMDEATLQRWMCANIPMSPYPNLIPEQFALNVFQRVGCHLDGTFFIPTLPGWSKYMVFTR